MKLKNLWLSTIIIFLNLSTFSQVIYQESFETGFGIWHQLVGSDTSFKWIRNTGSTPSLGTGPDNASAGSYYLYIEATGHSNPGLSTTIQSDTFNFSTYQNPILSFDYHMYGLGIGVLSFEIFDGYSWTEIWNGFQNLGNQWNNAKVCLRNFGGLSKVVFRITATTAFSDSSDIAIDNLIISNLKFQSITHTDVSCGGYNDGYITINTVGGFSPFRYSIDDGVTYTPQIVASPYTFNGLNGADYVIRVKDTSGCWVSGGVVILNEPEIPHIEVTKFGVQPCSYSHNGKFIITATGANSPFQYSINGFGGPFTTNDTFPNLDTGTYQIAVKNSLGCIASAGNHIIDAPLDIFVFEIQKQDIATCYGDSTGSLKVIAGGGTQPFTYSINEGVSYETNNYFAYLKAGIYRFFVKDYNGCIDTSTYTTLVQPTKVKIDSLQITNVNGCFGDSTGVIKVIASGGTGAIVYSDNNDKSYQISNTFTNLASATYKIWVHDANQCKFNYGDVLISQPSKLIIDSIVSHNVTGCYGDSSATISFYVHGGSGSYQYSIDSGANFQTSNIFNGLKIGTYYPVVRDQNLCTQTSNSITITQPSQLDLINIVKYDVSDCYNGNNGTIQIFVTNGTSPYYYSIDTGTTYQTNYNFSNLYARKYHVLVHDNNGCTVDGGYVKLNQPTQIVISQQIATDVSCYGQNDGTVLVNASGGTGQLVYSTDNGASFPFDINAISYHKAGSYPIKVRDDNNCTVNGTTLIINQPDSLQITSVNFTNVTGCYGDSTGQIIINAIGGKSPLNFSIDNGSNLQTDSVFNHLAARTGYIPYVKDINGCIVLSNAITIGQPGQLVFVTQSHDDIKSCHGQNTGTISISAHGGTGTLSYSIDSGVTYFANAGNFSNLYAGTYFTKIKDQNNCLVNGRTEIIIEPDSLKIDSVTTTDVVCNGQSNGTLYIHASGGQTQLMYSYDNGSTYGYSQYIPNLNVGYYTVAVKDAYNCVVYDYTIIDQPTKLLIDSVVPQNVNTCYTDATGAISIYAHGGVSPIRYSYTQINGSTSSFGLNNIFNNLYAGAYYITIKDTNGCIVNSSSFNITEPTLVKISKDSVNQISCNGDANGSIYITATGGVGNYKYSLDNGITWSNLSNFSNLTPNSYYIRVKDSNGCLNTQAKIEYIYEPSVLKIYSVNTTDLPCHNVPNGYIKIYATGGTPAYSYYLNDSLYSSSGAFNDLDSGNYQVKVVDNHGCLVIGGTPYHLSMPDPYSLFNKTVDTGCSPLTVNFSPKKLSSGVGYNWSFGDNQYSQAVSPFHVYENHTQSSITFYVQLFATSSICYDSTLDSITVYSQPDVLFGIDTIVHIMPDSVVNFTNLNTNLTDYVWNFGDGETFSGLDPGSHTYSNCGNYTVTLTAQNQFGCSETFHKYLYINAFNPIASYLSDANDGCSPITINFKSTSFNNLTQEWYINNNLVSSDTAFSYVFDDAGSYMLKLKAIGYCNLNNILSKIIEIYPKPIVDFFVLNDTINLKDSVRFTNFTTNAVHYIWLFGDSAYSYEAIPRPHKYSHTGVFNVTLIAKSEHGCVDSLTIENAVFVSNEFRFALPNAFSPDNDGINDYFKPVTNLVDKATIEIYDRRGQIVYRTTNFETEYWDGTFNGHPLPIDTYVWRAYIQYKDGTLETQVGNVTIIR